MNQSNARSRLCGCYVTIPTLFHDDDLSIDLEAIRRHVRFVIEGGITTGNGVLLAGGAAGDFSTMTLDERLQVAEVVVDEAGGRVPVVLGAQSTSTLELVRLAKAAEKLGIEFIQVSPPYYFAHTEDDFFEYVMAAASAANVGLVIYNTFWTSYSVSTEMVEKLRLVPNVIGLKWSMPDKGNMEFEQVISKYSSHFSIIDNQMRFVTSHMLGVRGIEVHVCNYWPQWGVRMWKLLENKQYIEAQQELIKVAMPFMALWVEMEQYTSGDGYLDKLCMELVGLNSSRCRPPTRDIRDKYRERAREMLLQAGVPNVIPARR
jgi:dihydrodipicolinate synthase/N-acetylneuraminate lyase